MYRRRFGLDKKTKIFICKQYFSFKKALLERGWHENPDFNSTVFHLKFTVKRDSIYGTCVSQQNNENYVQSFDNNLHDFQIVNHFSNNNVLTSKVGLTASLKNLTWWTNDSMDSFYPKCFILSKQQGNLSSMFQNEMEEFNEEYRFVYSQSILKNFVKIANKDIEEYRHTIPKLLVSLNICEKRLLTIDDQINQFGECNGELCSETEWKILELNKKQLT